MSFVLASLVVAVFAAIIEYFNLPNRAREVGRRGLDCLAVLRDASLEDDAKERALQRHARRLFMLLGILVGGSLLALFVPLGGVWILEWLGMASLDRVLGVLQRIDFLVGVTAVALLGYLLIRQLQPS